MEQIQMNTSLYALLNAEAKKCWQAVELRQTGNSNPARQRERNEIRSILEMIAEARCKNGYLLILDQEGIADPRWMFYTAKYHWLSGYGADTSFFVRAIKQCRVPVYFYTQIRGEIEERLSQTRK